MKRYCYIVFLLVIFLAACRKDTSIDVTVLPEETTTGEDTFGCLIDGWIYVGGRYFDYNKPSINFAYYGSTNKIEVEVKVKGINNTDPYLAFTIVNPVDKQNCQFTNARWLSSNKDLGDGTVEITRFDQSAKIISGRFSGNQIKHGQFDVVYRQMP
jgi:hypothetical protein